MHAVMTPAPATSTHFGREFRVPGPGSWELDPVHFPRPITREVEATIGEPFSRGFALGTAIYGLTLDRFEAAPQHGIWYHRAVPFGAPPDAAGPPPTCEVFEQITRLPHFAERLERGRLALERKAWRDELRRWDDEVKPAADAAHRALQSEDVAAMSDEALIDHLRRARRQLADMWVQHHVYTCTALLPVGDYLAHAAQWTGMTFGELLRPLQGSSPVSRGAARDELDALVLALRGREEALALLDLSPEDALTALTAQAGAIGDAARAWIDVAGHRSVGYDISEPYALEMPEMLVGALRARLQAHARHAEEAAAIAAAEAAVRARVSAEHHAQLDELLAEARLMNRMRDERGNHSDSWATGLLRRAMLEAGRRLQRRGTLDDATLAIDATVDELVALLRGQDGPSSDGLKEHRAWRTARPSDAVPAFIGEPPSPPPPADWLPEGSRRLARAVEAAIGALFGEPEKASESKEVLTGLPVSAGSYEGIARVVLDGSGFARLQPGDVLVTRATSATFNVVVPLLGAIVTDRGGQLCHAAIVARESGIPAVVGTKTATSVIPDGARVRVDGAAGTVTVLR
jgi:phosphohistidine swiveling domain-containing protein